MRSLDDCIAAADGVLPTKQESSKGLMHGMMPVKSTFFCALNREFNSKKCNNDVEIRTTTIKITTCFLFFFSVPLVISSRV